MSHYKLESLLATGVSNKELIDALIAGQEGPPLLRLTLNKNLTLEQATRLLKRTDGYGEALIASRLDLTDEQVTKIINSKRVLSRVALVNRPNRPGAQMSTELVDHILSQNWFTPDYAVCFQSGPQSFTPVQLTRIKKKINSRIDAYVFTSSYRGLVTQIDNLKRDCGYDRNYLGGSGLSLESDRKLATLSNLTIPEFLKDLDSLKSFKVNDVALALAIERRLQPIQSSTAQILLSLLPDWHGTVRELLNTVKTLATTNLVAD